jgi:uncharacterized protein (TIGR03118 family)
MASTSTLAQVNLVSSNPADGAQLLDPAFINAWGIAIRPAGFGGHWWIANTDTSRVTLYVGDSESTPFTQDWLSVLGVPGAAGPTIEVPVDPPTRDGEPLAPATPTPATTMPPSNPTGQVYSGSNTDFLIDGISLDGTPIDDAPARFITVSEDGTIAAWGELGATPGTRMNAFVVAVDNSAEGAIYKGVTVSSEGGSGNLLYAANFSQNRIDVFDAQWQPTALAAGFVHTPPGGRSAEEFAPFNIERVYDASLGQEVLIVAFAKIANAAEGEEESTDGYVAKFTLAGEFLAAGDAGGLFNAPWGVALAPESFGAFGGDLIVGNFGDGKIIALDIATLEPQGYLLDGNGDPVVIDGLWDLIFGNGASLGRADRLYFSAGPEEESHGLFGGLSVTEGEDADAQFLGTAADDIHSGASGNDALNGGGGNDVLLGQRGDDTIKGGLGDDRLFGGLGDDLLDGNQGNDLLAGGRGNDTINGRDGDDVAVGGAGDDRIGGGAGNDLVDGGDGNDRLSGEQGDDEVQGGDGNDQLDGGAGNDLVTGGSGNDKIQGRDGDDTIVGGAGNDDITTGSGADSVLFLLPDDGADIIRDFTSGSDRIGVDAQAFGIGALVEGVSLVFGSAADESGAALIYDAGAGKLWFDADGAGEGEAVLLARIFGNPALTDNDFYLFGNVLVA